VKLFSVGPAHMMREWREPCVSHNALRAGTSRALQVRARETVLLGLIGTRWVAIREASSSRLKTRLAMVVVTGEAKGDCRDAVWEERASVCRSFRTGGHRSGVAPEFPHLRYGRLQALNKIRPPDNSHVNERFLHPPGAPRGYGRLRRTHV